MIKKALAFTEDLVFSKEFHTGLYIGAAVLVAAIYFDWLSKVLLGVQ